MSLPNEVNLHHLGSTGYNIARSVRMRSSASAYLNRTPSVAGNQQIFTWSGWVKRGKLGVAQGIFGPTLGSGYATMQKLSSVFFNSSDQLQWTEYYSADGQSDNWSYSLVTTQVFRDPSAWYHIVFAMDTTQATASNRMKLYVNGVQITTFSTANYVTQNFNSWVNSTSTVHYFGAYGTSGLGNFYDGYLTEVNFVNAQQLTPSSFGSTNAVTGVWQPAKYTGTYGTNGFYLNFSDNSASTAAAIGKDSSGNGNNWTPNNISVTAGTTYDSMTDVPTLTSATAANYCVLSPLWASSVVSGGNLNIVGDSNSRTVVGSIVATTGKWYAEGTFTSGYATNGWFFVWDTSTPYVYGNFPATTGQTGAYYQGTSGNIVKSITGTVTTIGTYSTWTNSDIIGMAFDADAGTISFYKNNTLQATVTDAGFVGRPLTFGIYYYAGNASMNFGQRPFSYTPPTGYVALNTYNLPTSTITNGAAYMAATTYTGTGVTGRAVSNAVNGISMQPDLVWVKSRSSATYNELYDSVRGVSKRLFSNDTAAEADFSPYGLTAFSSGGFTVSDITSSGYGVNENGVPYIGWQWKASNTTATNTNGSITSTVSAGATQGFSVVTYTGTGAAGTVGHGLGVAPSMIIIKNRSTVDGWPVYHASIGNTYYLGLNLTNAASQTAPTSVAWNNTTPTSTVFSVGGWTSTSGNSGNLLVAYCFSAVAGYSAFGSYTGNGSTDGPFVYCGFRPRWILIKVTNTTSSWFLFDSSRSTYNAVLNYLLPNDYGAAGDLSQGLDFLSNGFKLRDVGNGLNGSGNSYIYAAFAENPFKNSLAR